MSSKKSIDVIRPILSSNRHEARLRALRLYRLWIRQVPYIRWLYPCHFHVTEAQIRDKIREEFFKNKDETDIRIIDRLIFKSQTDLREIGEQWAQPCHVVGQFFNDTVDKRPHKFLDKFFTSKD